MWNKHSLCVYLQILDQNLSNLSLKSSWQCLSFFLVFTLDHFDQETKQKSQFLSMSLGWIDVQYVKSFAQGCSWGNTAFSLITLIYCLYDSQQPNKTYSSKKIHSFYSSILKVTSLLLLFFLNLSSIIPFKVYIIGFITSYTLTYSKLL